MKRLAFFTLSLLLAIQFEPIKADDADENLEIWDAFIQLLQSNSFPRERIRPLHPSLLEPIAGFLDVIRENTDWEEWRVRPEFIRNGNRQLFILPLTFDGESASYCFSFIEIDSVWYFQHLEAITLRLDQLDTLPVSEFPDLPESTKAWMREEIKVSREVWMYTRLLEEQGREEARSWFLDGAGYSVAAQSWVPYFPLSKAFILYLCWEQSNLRGNQVTLEQLDEDEAHVRIDAIYLKLYQQTAHLQTQISFAEYLAFYESIWHDRALRAGWSVDFRYDGSICHLHFQRGPGVENQPSNNAGNH